MVWSKTARSAGPMYAEPPKCEGCQRLIDTLVEAVGQIAALTAERDALRAVLENPIDVAADMAVNEGPER